MCKRPAAIIIVLGIFCTIGVAQGPTGIKGFVYDHNNQKAGTKLDTIYVIRLDESGEAEYYYRSGDSYWITNDDYGLEDGHWGIYGVTDESGTNYYSLCYSHWWVLDSLIAQDIHCTNLSPPQIPYDY